MSQAGHGIGAAPSARARRVLSAPAAVVTTAGFVLAASAALPAPADGIAHDGVGADLRDRSPHSGRTATARRSGG
jgi:hypothetical protein